MSKINPKWSKQRTESVLRDRAVLSTVSCGMVIGFRGKGNRKVKGEVIEIRGDYFKLKLQTDYIGANVDWYQGELKDFNLLDELSNFRIL